MMVEARLVLWRNLEGQLVDWAVLFEDFEKNSKHVVGYTPEFVLRVTAPVMGDGPDRIGAAKKVAADLLVASVQTSTELRQLRDEFAYIVEHGKPKPKVFVVDDHDWAKIARETAWGGVR